MVKVRNGLNLLSGRLEEVADKERFVISGQVLADCNKYVRYAEGDLEQSSHNASDLQNGKLIWDTPYASEVYYTGTPSKAKNPDASLMWCQKAMDEHYGEWVDLVTKALKKGIDSK